MLKVKNWYELYPMREQHFKEGDIVRVLWISGASEDTLSLLSTINFRLQKGGGYFLQVPVTDSGVSLLKSLPLSDSGVILYDNPTSIALVMAKRVYKLKDIIGVYYKNKRRSA